MNFKEKLKENGMTVKDLSDQLEITRVITSRKVNNKNDWKFKEILKIANLLKIDSIKELQLLLKGDN